MVWQDAAIAGFRPAIHPQSDDRRLDLSLTCRQLRAKGARGTRREWRDDRGGGGPRATRRDGAHMPARISRLCDTGPHLFHISVRKLWIC